MDKQENKPENNEANNNNNHQAAKSEFLKCLSDFFKRDLVTIPVVKKYPHVVVQQRCGLRAATLELDTAAYPNIEYVAGTRLSVFPVNPANHVQTILDHLMDDLSPGGGTTIALPPNSAWWTRWVQLHKNESLRFALSHLFDITIAPSREVVRLVVEQCLQQPQSTAQKELKKRLDSVSASNEAWEKWLCSGHRTLKSLFDELDSVANSVGGSSKAGGHRKYLSAVRLLSELDSQAPRQYSISNIKSSKRFRTEVIVFEHRFNLRQIELNLRQLKERESFYKSVSSPKSPSLRSSSTSGRSSPASSSPIALNASGLQQVRSRSKTPGRRSHSTSPAARANGADVRNVTESSRRSGTSTRSIRSLAPFATSPPISTHQVKRVPSFSGPLMSMYATAATSSGHGENSTSGPLDQGATAAQASKQELMRSRMSLVSAPETNFSDPAAAHHHQPESGPSSSAASPKTAATVPQASAAQFPGLCSNYLLNLNTNDQIMCEFVENPRFTLKGNRERPIMMIGQDVGLVAFRPFWQQRILEHDRAQVFYTLFKDLAPKKFGEMQLVCVTGHKSRIEELLFRREINLALTSKILSSVTYINRKLLVGILNAAHTKSQLLFAQYNSSARSTVSSLAVSAKSSHQSAPQQQQQQKSSGSGNSLQINNKELLELGDRMYKLLVEHTGCLYTCCDPHMTQAIEILLFESIARNNQALTRERIMQLLPKWKGKDSSAASTKLTHSSSKTTGGGSKSSKKDTTQPGSSIYTLENHYERARIVQEIYDNSI